MTTPDPTPAPGAAPAPAPSGMLAHLERWAEEHLVPDLDAVRGDIAKAAAAVQAHAAAITQVAGLVVTVVKTIDPAAAPGAAALVTEVEAAVSKITADLAAL